MNNHPDQNTSNQMKKQINPYSNAFENISCISTAVLDPGLTISVWYAHMICLIHSKIGV